MIDGAGNVRVLDFGIAVPLSDQDALRAFGGTPGFIPPELLAGNGLTERSDLYAWGLVIYFAATGGLPGNATEDTGPAANATLLSAGFDHTMAEYVCACLQDDPARRPSSAAEIVNGLRTGDSLREAVQAGHMPPDEVVTSARTWLPAGPLVDGMFAGGLALLAVIMLLADKTLFLSRCGLVKSPDVLQDMAEQTLTSLGCRAPAGPVLTGVTVDTGGLQFIRGHPTIPAAWRRLEAGEIPVAFFWYRQGDPRLPRPAPLGESRWERLASPTPGTATVRLDGRGKLLSVQIVTASPVDAPGAAGTDWSKLFESAGLPWQEFKEAQAHRLPPVFADGVQTWEGPFPADPTLSVKVTGATLGGCVVFFDVDQPWELALPNDALINSGSQSTQFVAFRIALWLIAIALAAALAWSHASLGHADWRGAWRVSAAATILAALDWLFGSPHNLVPAEELASSFLWLNLCVSYGAAAGVAYLAVEPFARRWWPWSIITTRRLVSGRLADRGIWTDLLLGMVVGLAAVLMRQLGTVINQSLGIPVSGLNDFDLGQNVLDQFGARFKMSIVVAAVSGAVIESLLLLTLVVALKRLTASTLAAALLMVLMLASLAIVGRGILSPIDWTVRILLWAIVCWLLLRHGLLASIAALATFHAVNNAPITLNWSRWYAPTGVFVVAVLAVALTIAWRLSRPPITSPTAGRQSP
jgi:hypothetical protein